MRSHTNLRSAFRFGMMPAVGAGIGFVAAPAHADEQPHTSTGTAALKFDYASKLDTTIDTGFLGPSVAQVGPLQRSTPSRTAVRSIPSRCRRGPSSRRARRMTRRSS